MKKTLLLVLLSLSFIGTSYAEYELKVLKGSGNNKMHFVNGSLVKKVHYDFLFNINEVKELTKRSFKDKTYYVYEGQIITKQRYLSLYQKVQEEKRIAEEKRITEEKKAEEKKAEEKKKELEQRILFIKNYPGFRNLKPGLHYDELKEFCDLRKYYWVKCYGIDNIKFKAYYSDNDLLERLSLDMGPIVNTEGFLSVIGENDSNIFIKMRKTMGKNYSRDYGYSERDRQLFNEYEKSRLYEVYSKGQVVLEISRKEKDWSSDLWLYIHYLDPSKAETFLNDNRPVRASDDDF